MILTSHGTAFQPKVHSNVRGGQIWHPPRHSLPPHIWPHTLPQHHSNMRQANQPGMTTARDVVSVCCNMLCYARFARHSVRCVMEWIELHISMGYAMQTIL